jgi:hypothetical protein
MRLDGKRLLGQHRAGLEFAELQRTEGVTTGIMALGNA